MIEEPPFLDEITHEDVERFIAGTLRDTPFSTPGQLRDHLYEGQGVCCFHCGTHNPLYGRRWAKLYLILGPDWREVE